MQKTDDFPKINWKIESEKKSCWSFPSPNWVLVFEWAKPKTILIVRTEIGTKVRNCGFVDQIAHRCRKTGQF